MKWLKSLVWPGKFGDLRGHMFGLGSARTVRDIVYPFVVAKGRRYLSLTIDEAERLHGWLGEQLERADVRRPVEIQFDTKEPKAFRTVAVDLDGDKDYIALEDLPDGEYKMSNVCGWDRALTAEEVANLYRVDGNCVKVGIPCDLHKDDPLTCESGRQ